MAVRRRPAKGRHRAVSPGPQTPAVYQPPHGMTRTLACTEQPLSGRLLGVRPQLEKGADAGISVLLPSGRAEIIGWFRRYDPDHPQVYWLRRPLDLPRGSRLRVETRGQCRVDVIITR